MEETTATFITTNKQQEKMTIEIDNSSNAKDFVVTKTDRNDKHINQLTLQVITDEGCLIIDGVKFQGMNMILLMDFIQQAINAEE